MEWIGALWLPVVLLVHAGLARSHEGFKMQHPMTRAGTPARFVALLREVGGAGAVRTGVWLDLGFIAVLTVPPGLVLAGSERPALVGFAVLAAVVDVGEGLLLLRAVREPTAGRLRRLRRVSTGKLSAYLVMLGATVAVVARQWIG